MTPSERDLQVRVKELVESVAFDTWALEYGRKWNATSAMAVRDAFSAGHAARDAEVDDARNWADAADAANKTLLAENKRLRQAMELIRDKAEPFLLPKDDEQGLPAGIMCGSCNRVWLEDEPEEHDDNCAYVIAQAALAPAQLSDKETNNA